MVNIIASALVWIIIFICVIRFFYFSGIPIKHNKLTKYILRKSDLFEGYCPTKKDYTKVAAIAFSFRFILYVISGIIMLLFIDGIKLNFNEFLNQWTKWDSYHYIKLALNGYSGSIEDGKHLFLVFFPLYPWIIRAVNFVFHHIQLSGLFVSNICYIVGCCYLYGIASLEYGKEIAKKTVLYFSIFPFSFFLGGIETESLFFLLLAACFYYIKKQRWILVGILGALASITRMAGILLIIPAFLEWAEQTKPFKKIYLKEWKQLRKDIFLKLSGTFFIFVGPFIYFLLNYIVDKNSFQFLIYQKEHWYQEAQYFGTTITQLWERAFGEGAEGFVKAAIWIPDVILFFFAVFVLYYAVLKHQNKYVMFFLAYLIVNYAPSWLLSGGRYMSLAIPMFLFMAECSERHKWLHIGIVMLSSLLLGIYMTGFLMGRQIM